MKIFRAAPLLLMIVVGCKITKYDTIKTGMFSDKPEEHLSVYSKVKGLEKKPTKKELEKIFHFDFNAPNLERLDGPTAFRIIFGDNYFQGGGSDPDKLDLSLTKAGMYHGVFIPFRYIVTEIDRIYWSTKKTHRVGDDILIRLIFKQTDDNQDILYYIDCHSKKIDSEESDSAFAQGLVELIDHYGNFGGNVNAIVNKIKELMGK